MFWQADNNSTDPNKSLINAVAMVYASDTILYLLQRTLLQYLGISQN